MNEFLQVLYDQNPYMIEKLASAGVGRKRELKKLQSKIRKRLSKVSDEVLHLQTLKANEVENEICVPDDDESDVGLQIPLKIQSKDDEEYEPSETEEPPKKRRRNSRVKLNLNPLNLQDLNRDAEIGIMFVNVIREIVRQELNKNTI